MQYVKEVQVDTSSASGTTTAYLFVEEPDEAGSTSYDFQLCKSRTHSVPGEHISLSVSDLGNGYFGDIYVVRDALEAGGWPPQGVYATDALYEAVFEYLPGPVQSRPGDHWNENTRKRWMRFLSQGLAAYDPSRACFITK